MPNALAYVMLMVWPFATLLLFRRLPLERAVVWSILGGYLILPPLAEFDLPLVPAMDKFSIASLSAFAACLIIAGKWTPLWPRNGLARVLVTVFLAGVAATVLTNREPLVFRVIENTDPIEFISFTVPGLGLRDMLSALIAQVIILLPFFIGRAHLASEAGMKEILLALALGGFAYSVPALVETVISPVLNIYIYGFFQHDFGQMIRASGYRPIVFLPHGLWLAIFMATALISAAAILRQAPRDNRMPWLMITGFLAFVLLACKSLAALVFGAVLTPLILLLGHRTKVWMAVLIASFAVFYPMLRNVEALPVEAVIESVENISPDRANSLAFRVGNEEQLLDRAKEKPWFGWGKWGRNLLLDSESGRILTVPDGNWIIVFGQFGWLGYIAQMGLLALPMALLAWQMRGNRESDVSPYASAVVIVIAATMMDMLLNDTLTPFTWLCAGAVLGYVEQLRNPQSASKKPALFGDGPIIGAMPKDRQRGLL